MKRDQLAHLDDDQPRRGVAAWPRRIQSIEPARIECRAVRARLPQAIAGGEASSTGYWRVARLDRSLTTCPPAHLHRFHLNHRPQSREFPPLRGKRAEHYWLWDPSTRGQPRHVRLHA